MKISERILVSLVSNPFVTAVPYLEAEARYLLTNKLL